LEWTADMGMAEHYCSAPCWQLCLEM